MLFMGYMARFYAPIRGLTRLNEMLQRSAAAAERVFEIMDAQPEVDDKKDAIELPTIKGDIEFKNVVFIFAKDRLENWIEFLETGSTDEEVEGPRVKQGRRVRDAAKSLADRCKKEQADPPFPPSLVWSCKNWHRLVKRMQGGCRGSTNTANISGLRGVVRIARIRSHSSECEGNHEEKELNCEVLSVSTVPSRGTLCREGRP